jgi:hypothetical protein
MGKKGLSIMAYKLWIGKRRAIYNGAEIINDYGSERGVSIIAPIL